MIFFISSFQLKSRLPYLYCSEIELEVVKLPSQCSVNDVSLSVSPFLSPSSLSSLSESMEPAFHRGDLLFLTNFDNDPIKAGEIVVFKIKERDIPIVHRVIKVHVE